MSRPFLTIGHSTRSAAEFLELLGESDVGLLVDVRRIPGSNRHPQFNADPLAAALAEAGIEYHHSPGLTGRRPVSRDVLPELNAWWENRSFHNYADHALSREFGTALAELRELGRETTTAVMCSEAVWWRCHRRIIADHLLAHVEYVRHILGPDHVDPAQLSAGALIAEDRTVTYPAS